MLPKRRKLPSEDLSLGDDDIIAAVPMPTSDPPPSGTRAMARRVRTPPPLPVAAPTLPRFHSSPDLAQGTATSQVVQELACLSDPLRYPRLVPREAAAAKKELVGEDALVA